MKKQSWFLSALALFLSVGISLTAQQTTPSSPSTSDPSAQQPATPDQAQPTPTPSQTPDNTQQTPAQSPSQTTPSQATPNQPMPSQTTPSQTPDQTQPTTGQTPDRATPPASDSSATSAQAGGSQSFSGTIVKTGDKYMFDDEASGKTYDIDHQDQVQKYEGKRVKVHGTLDPNGTTIHLQ